MRKALALLIFALATCGLAHAQTAVRVKCGGGAYTDSKGQAWSADKDSNGGLVSTVSGSVAGTTDPTLFQDGRMPSDTAPLVYTFPVANGSYHANLYFAELYNGDSFVGGRVFNVKVEGTTVLQNFDIYKTVGANTALIKGVDFSVTNGAATIELDNVPGHDRGAAPPPLTPAALGGRARRREGARLTSENQVPPGRSRAGSSAT